MAKKAVKSVAKKAVTKAAKKTAAATRPHALSTRPTRLALERLITAVKGRLGENPALAGALKRLERALTDIRCPASDGTDDDEFEFLVEARRPR